MPIYEYHCDTCGTEVEIFHRSMASAENAQTCDHCGSQQLTRKFSLAGVSMGSGGSWSGGSDSSGSSSGGVGGGCWNGSCGL